MRFAAVISPHWLNNIIRMNILPFVLLDLCTGYAVGFVLGPFFGGMFSEWVSVCIFVSKFILQRFFAIANSCDVLIDKASFGTIV